MEKQKVHDRRPMWRLRAVVLPAIIMLLAVMATTALAETYGNVEFALTPAFEWMRWSNNLGLSNNALYGGRLGLRFSDYAGVNGFFYTNGRVATRLGDTGLFPTGTAFAADQDLRVNNYGGNVTVNLLRDAPIIPFFRADASVFQFRPRTAGPDSRALAFGFGGGAKLALAPRVQADLSIQDELFRVNRANFAAVVPPGGPSDGNAGALRNNLKLGAGVSFLFGAPTTGERTTYRDRPYLGRRYAATGPAPAITYPITPFFGTLNFASDTGLRSNTNTLGVRAGVGIGDAMVLNAYYWNGRRALFGASTSVQSWGGEAQFNIPTGTTIVPFVVGGAGQLNFGSRYRDSLGFRPKDQLMLILGGGLSYQLGTNTAINAAIRDNVLSAQNLTAPGDPNRLFNNILYSVGLSYSIGFPTY